MKIDARIHCIYIHFFGTPHKPLHIYTFFWHTSQTTAD
jgi:hypothetical protein